MAVHDNFAALAVRLIDKNGRNVSLVRETTLPDPAQPWLPGTTSTTQQTVKAVFDNDMGDDLLAVLTQVAGRGDQESTGLGARQAKVFIAARGLSLPVDEDTQILDGGELLEISDFELIKPGPTPILYIFTVLR